MFVAVKYHAKGFLQDFIAIVDANAEEVLHIGIVASSLGFIYS